MNALATHIIDSEATVTYIKLMQKIASSFQEIDICPIDRVSRIWYAAYFMRIWRQWIKENGYSLTENFISLNAYACLEVNAHSLIQVIRKFRDDGVDHFFLPCLFSSQQCEQTFRQLRTMTTLNWTKVNFSILELTHMISRIDLQNDIAYFKLKNAGISLPRIVNRIEKLPVFSMPFDEEIKVTILNAKKPAVNDALRFGMKVNESQISSSDLPSVDVNDIDILMDEDDYGEILMDGPEQDVYDFSESEELSELMVQNLFLQDSSGKNKNADNSRFTQITDKDGLTKIVPKSAVVWHLSTSKGQLSNDRLIRVQNSSSNNKSHRRSKSAPDFSARLSEKRVITISDEICIGQWCMFSYTTNKRRKNVTIENYIIGAITNFRYSTGKNQKERQYTWENAPINKSNIQALATWYKITRNGEFIPVKHASSFYLDITNYFATIADPNSRESTIYLAAEAFEHINIFLERLQKQKK